MAFERRSSPGGSVKAYSRAHNSSYQSSRQPTKYWYSPTGTTMSQLMNYPNDRSALTHQPLSQAHTLAVDQSRQATLLQAMRVTEEEPSPEAFQAFAIYCKRHYEPQEIATARLKALTDKFLILERANLSQQEFLRQGDAFLRKFQYCKAEVEEAHRRYKEIVQVEASPVLYATPIVTTNIMDDDHDPYRIGHGMAATFSELGATCEFVEPPICSDHSRVMQFRFRPGKGVDVNTFKTKIDNLIVRNNLPKRPVIRLIPGFVAVEVLKGESEPPRIDDYVRLGGDPDDRAVKLSFGIDLSGNSRMEIDLTRSTTPHGLISATSGVGKSCTLRVLALAGAAENPPDKLNLLLISVQKGSFLGFERLPHLWRGTNGQDWGIVSDARRAYAALQDLKVEAARREQEFDRVGVGDITAYNARMPHSMPHIAVLIDEVRLVHGAFSSIGEFDDYFTDTSQLFRKLGIHLFPACQYVKRVLSPAVRECLRARIVHLCASVEASRAVLNSDMAVSLDELHDGYFQLGDNVESAVRFTSFYIDDAAINYIVDWCCRQYPVPRQLHSSLSFEDLFNQDNDADAWTVDTRAVDRHTVAYGVNVTKTMSEDLWADAPASCAHQQDEDYAVWLKMQRYYREEKKPTQNGLFRFCFDNQEAPTSGKAFYRNQATIERVKAKFGAMQ